ncbi:tRNA1(Val) (adenine(37)-N6)-methyltransferase [Lunatimonas salinarum]|uniref:tRNA1(Val) (adenine(37)-N6)-methyltransferase n=1 Tax=Lunatimonas salinarum TaxID=1774590 RepID=UPI002475C96E|nr:methyltransferase [Lunatimonas salinarum]
MGGSVFQFKQFTLHQDRCAMKFSTDTALLGALAKATAPLRILDVGTGTGALAIMLAQRYKEAQISAVEIDSHASEQARSNALMSPWANRIEVLNQPFQKFCEAGHGFFDLIVSNPPYYASHLTSADSRRNTALHQHSLSFFELAKGVQALLTEKGLFWIILPPRQMADFELVASGFGLWGVAKIQVYDRDGKPILREVQAFSRRLSEGNTPPGTLLIRDSEGQYSFAYKELLRPYLLHF